MTKNGEKMMTHVVALSGGKDSTALALRMKEVWPDLDPWYVCTPTGDELPPMKAHWALLEQLLGKPITRVGCGIDLVTLTKREKMLPNFRARFCTRILKVVPYQFWMQQHAPAVSYIGLRADEEGRVGIETDKFECVYPFREWGWGYGHVIEYLKAKGVEVPARTDCARCFYQTLHEWWVIWKAWPAIWESACDDEDRTGHTYRSEQRDTWPARLRDLAQAFCERGEPKQRKREGGCKVCRM